MNRERTIILAVVVLACGAVSFFNARSTALSELDGRQGPAQGWLAGASEATIKLEEQFGEQLDVLLKALTAEQKSLSNSLDDPSTSDSAVLEQSDRVISAREDLVRAVGRHIVELRGKLSAGKRDYLMGICAEAVRGPISRLGGGGYGRGRGGGMSRGGGAGGRSAERVRARLARRLRLDEEQVKVLEEKDPDFEAVSAGLRDALTSERAKLAAVFEDPESSNDELLGQIESLITTHSRIERRMAEHVLVLRPYLSAEQQKWLIGLCRRGFGSEGPMRPGNQ
ncbi:MAG: hypothetical protein JW720_03675 [Sedimentisphaerales bacterium]|nr:hypothetical protein [Sedimentisphaerales bacterium]